MKSSKPFKATSPKGLTKAPALLPKSFATKSSFSTKSLLIFLIVFGLVGGYAVYKSLAATIYYVSPGGNDSNSCTQSAPCATFNRAYTVASSGDTIEVACGSYGTQKLNRDNTKNASQYVTFQPPAGQPSTCVNLTGLLQFGSNDGGLSARWVYIKNMSFYQGVLQSNPTNNYGLQLWHDADNIVFDGIDGGKIEFSAPSNITVKNSDLGKCYANTKNQCLNRVAGDVIGTIFYQATNILLENNKIHDINSQGVLGECGDPSDTCHVDGLAIFSSGSPGMVVRGNRFYKNGVSSIALQIQNGGDVANVKLENNWIGKACDGLAAGGGCNRVAVEVRSPIPNLIFRFNSIDNGMVSCDGNGFQCGTSSSRAKFIGNIMQVAGGQAGVCNTTNADFYYNVEQQFSAEFGNPSSPCSSTDVFQNNLSFYNNQTQGANFDLHLNTSTSAPVNFVPSSVTGGCPATDIDGQSRPQGTACDAGADEYSTGSPGSSANVWLSPNGNDASCARSYTAVSYGNVQACKTFQRACEVSMAGDLVGVKAGTYLGDQYSRYISDTDCSDGNGADIDPTVQPAGSDPTPMVATARWVTFFCGDDETRDTVKGGLTSGFDVNANAHAYFKGKCFNWTHILMGEGGQTAYQTQNVIIDGWHVDGWEISGAKNIWLRNIEDGPAVYCGDTSYSSQYRCQDPGYGLFESKWAKVNSSSDSGFNGQGFIHQNRGVPAQNILVENLWEHDQQSRRSSGVDGGWHTGCMQIDNTLQAPLPTDNVILRNFLCERVAHIGPLIGEGTTGVTIENWQVSCPIEPLDNNTGQWATPACQQPGITLQSSTGNHANILIRYSDFQGTINTNGGDLTGKNVRVIGNIAPNYICTIGVLFDYNVRTNPSGNVCGSNSFTTSGSPLINVLPGTTCCAATPVTDWHLAGSQSFVNSINQTSSDYALAIDFDGQSRTAPRDAGADEYGGVVTPPPPPPPPKTGDLNGDNQVNISDLSILLSNYSTTNTIADINKDGTVNILDLSILLTNYGT